MIERGRARPQSATLLKATANRSELTTSLLETCPGVLTGMGQNKMSGRTIDKSALPSRSRTTESGACNHPLDGRVLAITMRAGEGGKAHAVQKISAGR